MMQGDACYLGIQLYNNAGNPITPEDIREVEITMGPLRKTYGADQLRFENGLWLVPLSQQETFALPGGQLRAQVRLCWTNGVVEGAALPGISLAESISREVI